MYNILHTAKSIKKDVYVCLAVSFFLTSCRKFIVTRMYILTEA